ncbi:hypothetical protein TNCV_3108551 [Trichonephila clavipes]|uniref:Uncharacterized protein n=1 Tax=Trichonephila clavipes TaxID=2585209 RepID=A0A8X6S476_TRICX|nr:hypothetical protein TNCV_3108551 [Trichonephila clavipes]
MLAIILGEGDHMDDSSRKAWKILPKELIEAVPQRFEAIIKAKGHATKYWHFPCIDEAHFWLNGYVNKQNCRIWSEANPQVYVETPLHPEKLTVWCALWAGGILLQKR